LNGEFFHSLTVEACRRAGFIAVSARQLKPIEKLMMKLTTKSQIETRLPELKHSDAMTRPEKS